MAMAVGCADEEQASGPTAPSLETGVQASAVPAGTPTSVEGVDGATHNNGAEETTPPICATMLDQRPRIRDIAAAAGSFTLDVTATSSPILKT